MPTSRTLCGWMLLTAVGASLSACYLFSDEPKARKQAGEGLEGVEGSGPAGGGAGEEGAKGEEAGSSDSSGLAGSAQAEAGASLCPELSGVLTTGQTLSATSECAYVIRGSTRVEGGSLTVEAGVEVRFEAGASLEIGRGAPGKLLVQGRADAPVRFVGEDGARWEGLSLGPQAQGTVLEHLSLADAGAELGAALAVAGPEVEIRELRVSGALGPSVELGEGARVELLGARLSSPLVAIRSAPEALGGLRELDLEGGTVIAVLGGRVRGRVEWPEGRYRVEGDVRVEGEGPAEGTGEGTGEGAASGRAQLSLRPNSKLGFAPGAHVDVGALGPGSLVALAAPEDGPIRLGPAAPLGAGGGAGSSASWGGVRVHGQGRLALRGVELAAGSERGEGMIVAEDTAVVSVEGCVLLDAELGVELRGNEVTLERFTSNEFVRVPAAVKLSPSLVGSLGALNRYSEAPAGRSGVAGRIVVERGKIQASTTWTRQAATLEVMGDVFVGGGATLTIAPGSVLAFAKGVTLGVGYYDSGSLDIGSKGDSVTLSPLVGGESWTGLILGPHTQKSRLEHLQLSGTAGVAGIELRGGAEALLNQVECRDCAGSAVSWECESQIGNIGVEAGGATPTAKASPSGCP